MTYFEYLNSNKSETQKKLDDLLVKYKVQPVGWGYIDCITMKDNFADFITEISELGIVIDYVSWWCYVNPQNPINMGCPHGLGGPVSDYYEGWFSELQSYEFGNDIEIAEKIKSYNMQKIVELNRKTLIEIRNKLEKPFQYTPTDFIPENKCVTPALWLLVPDDWRNPF